MSEPSLRIDLSAAAEAWTGLGAKEARRLVVRCVNQNSAMMDLKAAIRCMEILAAIDATAGGIQNNEDGLLGQALFTHALIAYVRATHSSGPRGPQDITAGLTVAQKAQHKALCDLRNKAVAHFGPAATPKGPMYDERLVLRMAPDGDIPHYVGNRFNYQGGLSTALHDLALTGAEILTKRRDASFGLLVAHLMEHQALVLEALRHRFDPEAFFQSPMADSFEGGEVELTVRRPA